MLLITGAAGFIGRHLINTILENHLFQPRQIVITFHRQKPLVHWLKSGIKAIRLDLTKKSQVKFLPKADTVVHLMAEMPIYDNIGDFVDCLKGNCLTTYYLLEFYKDQKIKKFIYASTVRVYNLEQSPPIIEDSEISPVSLYGISKLATELLIKKYAKEYGFNPIILRISQVYGFEQKASPVFKTFIEAALNKKPIVVWGAGKDTRDYIYIKDVIRAIFCALKSSKGGIFNVGSGRPTSMKQLAQKISKVFSNSQLPIIFDKTKNEAAYNFYLDISRAKKELKFVPQHNLEAGLRDYFLELKSNLIK